jgi:hypothetical protein
MKRQSKSSDTEHKRDNQDKADGSSLNPIRDDFDPSIASVKKPHRKKSIQMIEGRYEGTPEHAEGIPNSLKHADVEPDARAAAPRNKAEVASMEKTEHDPASHSRKTIKPKSHSEKKRGIKS